MKKIRLFLASSSELKGNREQFEIFIYAFGPGNQENNLLYGLVLSYKMDLRNVHEIEPEFFVGG